MASFPFKLAAVDIDDTLVGSDKRIGTPNRRAVKDLLNAGCRVVLASGRRHANIMPFFDALELNDYVISSHGARTAHPVTGQVLRRAPLHCSVTSQLIDEGLTRGYTVMLWLWDGIFAQFESPWLDVYREETDGDVVSIGDLKSLSDQPAEKVVWAATAAQVLLGKADFEKRYRDRLSVSITNDWWLEMTAPEAQKSLAIEAVAQEAGIERESVLAFGDGNNDVSLLKWAGLGVAMPHGRQSARNAARWIAPAGNPESALARAIERLLDGTADPLLNRDTGRDSEREHRPDLNHGIDS